jgi:hypothetical protein
VAIDKFSLPKITSYSTIFSTQQQIEISKSNVVEIDFSPMVIVGK